MAAGRVRTEVYLRSDIENALVAIEKANAALAEQVPLAQVAIFRAGFTAALQAVAASFDIRLDAPATRLEAELSFDRYLEPSNGRASRKL